MKKISHGKHLQKGEGNGNPGRRHSGFFCQYQSAWTARAHTTGNGEGD